MKTFFQKYYPELIAPLIVFLLFCTSLSFGFMTQWDDSSYVTGNPYLSFTAENFFRYLKHCPQGFYAPVTMYSFMLDYLFWGMAPFGYHLTNLLLQCGSAVLLIRILRRFCTESSVIFLCALLWAVSPQRLESVVWVAERRDVLSGFLALCSILLFMNAVERKKWPVSALVLYILAVLAKPSVVGVPFIFMIYYAWKRKNGKGLLICFSGALLLFLTCVCILHLFMPVSSWLEPPLRMLTVISHNFIFYVSNTILPLELNPIYPLVEYSDWWIVPFFAGIIVLWGLLCKRAGFDFRRIGMTSLVFLIVYLALFAAVTGGFRFNATDYADRYSYLPSLAVWGWIAYSVSQWGISKPEWRKKLLIFLVLLLAFHVYRTFSYLPEWQNEFRISRYALTEHFPPNDKACLFHASSSIADGSADGLELSATMLNANAQHVFPRDTKDSASCRVNTALVLLILRCDLMKDFSGALQWYRVLQNRLNSNNTGFLERHVYFSSFRKTMYGLLGKYGRDPEFMGFLRWCDKIGWDHSDPVDLFYCGLYAFRRNDFKRAASVWREALKYSPNDLNLQQNLKTAEKMAGRE